MVDMSHYEKAENLSLTRELVEYCHARGIATEAEPVPKRRRKPINPRIHKLPTLPRRRKHPLQISRISNMSHYEKAENLSLTRELVEYCHARGIATEAEPGRATPSSPPSIRPGSASVAIPRAWQYSTNSRVRERFTWTTRKRPR
jgi:hypothetical protein